ncbi:MAG TPA: DivIVA domain-containing protein [Mycobacteriales bacterium]|jgi:DivIVA domain-containing protein|nr:DivIVA domain-containing protein [Mycobacteriales bacterium]
MTLPEFPSARRSWRGYDEGDVDAFVARVAPVLGDEPGAEPVTARQVRTALFRRVPMGRRGYDAAAVDTYLAGAAQVLTAREPGPGPPGDPAELRPGLAAFRPRRVRLGRGYLPEEVDAFLGRLDRVLAAGERPGPEVVAEAAFRVVVGGYDMDAVDELLDRVEDHLTGTPELT